jgi:transcription elongation GreA/GreB family factor
MSVAFRRESDEEHLEPKFEIPIPPGPNRVTERGLALIRERVEILEKAVTGIADETARKAAQRDLRYWRTRLATARIVPPAAGDRVDFGCTVSFRLNGTERTIVIVGDDEADPAAGLLSIAAPLVRAMLEAEAGDMVDFGDKADAIAILSVRPSVPEDIPAA